MRMSLADGGVQGGEYIQLSMQQLVLAPRQRAWQLGLQAEAVSR